MGHGNGIGTSQLECKCRYTAGWKVKLVKTTLENRSDSILDIYIPRDLSIPHVDTYLTLNCSSIISIS